MNLKVAICDDSKADQEYIIQILNQWSQATNIHLGIHTFLSAEQFLFQYEEEKDFQILVLDIEMGKMNGIELAKKIRKVNKDIQILFATGYPDFITEGYEVDALHYLMKPINQEKLIKVMEKAIVNIHKEEKYILLQDNDEMLKLAISTIKFVEVFSHSCVIHTIEGTVETRTAISKLENELRTQFIRVHRSYLVNLEYIKKIAKTEIELEKGELVPLARRKYTEVNLAFINFYGGRQLSDDSERFIRIFIGILKENLYISVYNSTGKEIKKVRNQYISVKNSKEHGLGLGRVDSIVEKNKGFVNRQNEEGVFATEIMLPLI